MACELHLCVFYIPGCYIPSYSSMQLVLTFKLKMARLFKKILLLLVALALFLGLFIFNLKALKVSSSPSIEPDDLIPIVKHGRKIKVHNIESHYEDTPERLLQVAPDLLKAEKMIKSSAEERNKPSPPKESPSSDQNTSIVVKHKAVFNSSSESVPVAVIVRHKVMESNQPVIMQKGVTEIPPLKVDPNNISVKRGVVLAINYYEQQTMASRNMFQLQCWAKTLNLDVVQPATKDSSLLTPLNDQMWKSQLRFGDLFDTAEWKRVSDQYQYSSLINWEDFLIEGPQKVIVVSFNYPSVSVLKARQKAGEQVLHSPQGDRYKIGCDSKFPSSSEVNFLKTKGFTIVRQVCLNFYYGDELSLNEFNSHILGDYSSNEVTVIMEMWRGMGSGQRVLIRDSGCAETYPIQEIISPSQRLVHDAEIYVNRHFSGGPFLAVMGRYEMSLLTTHKTVPYCLKDTLYKFQQFKKDTKLENAFLSIDVGKYGSKKWRKGAQPEISNEVMHLFQGMYGAGASIGEWEDGFESVSGTKDAGYIGLLQKVIVTRAQCVLFVGGGAFQRHGLFMYKNLHHDSVCARTVDQCTSKNKFKL